MRSSPQHKEWAGKVAIDATDNVGSRHARLLRRAEGHRRSSRISLAGLQPVLTDGHLAMARAVGAGEYAVASQSIRHLSENVKIAGSPIEVFALDPVALFFGQVGISALAPHPNGRQARRQFHAEPGMPAVSGQVRQDSHSP